MSLRIAQLAFDRILRDVEEKVLGHPMGGGHESLLRASFQREVGPSVPQTSLTYGEQAEIAEKVRIILRHHCWINSDDPCWEVMVARMVKHLNDVASSQQPTALPLTPKGGIPDWATPMPRSSHKGPRVACPLPGCPKRITALLDHLAFQHGIDTVKNRNVIRDKHIEKMGREIKVQHLVQDAGELNSLREGIEEVERQLKRVDPSYTSKHCFPVHEREETDPDSPKFPSTGAYTKILTRMLIDLREAGKETGWLYSRVGKGTYSAVLADLKQVLAQAMETEGRLV